MATSSDFRTLALLRLREATTLYEQELYESSYYMAGYAVELALKACICKNLKAEIFTKQVVSGNVLKAFQIHDLVDLAVLAGLKQELNISVDKSNAFNKSWSIVLSWDEQRRYHTGCSRQTAKIFLDSVNIITTWIKQHW